MNAMDDPIRYKIRFDALELAEASQAAESLRDHLCEVIPDIAARRIRTDASAMDFGSALEIALAAPVVLELAKGIAAWLARSPTSSVTITGADGVVLVEKISSRDAFRLAKKLGGVHVRR
jgi:hypothetical protein